MKKTALMAFAASGIDHRPLLLVSKDGIPGYLDYIRGGQNNLSYKEVKNDSVRILWRSDIRSCPRVPRSSKDGLVPCVSAALCNGVGVPRVRSRVASRQHRESSAGPKGKPSTVEGQLLGVSLQLPEQL